MRDKYTSDFNDFRRRHCQSPDPPCTLYLAPDIYQHERGIFHERQQPVERIGRSRRGQSSVLAASPAACAGLCCRSIGFRARRPPSPCATDPSWCSRRLLHDARGDESRELFVRAAARDQQFVAREGITVPIRSGFEACASFGAEPIDRPPGQNPLPRHDRDDGRVRQFPARNRSRSPLAEPASPTRS